MDWLSLVEGVFRDAQDNVGHRVIVAGVGAVVSVLIVVALNKSWAGWMALLARRKTAARALREQGEYHAQLKHRHEAMELYDLAVQLNPKEGHVYYLRGSLHAELGDPNRAVSDWRRCLARLPGHREARQRLAQMGGQSQPLVPRWALLWGAAAVLLLFTLVGVGTR